MKGVCGIRLRLGERWTRQRVPRRARASAARNQACHLPGEFRDTGKSLLPLVFGHILKAGGELVGLVVLHGGLPLPTSRGAGFMSSPTVCGLAQRTMSP